MSWHVYTSFATVSVKTRLSFLFTPLIDDERPPQISGDFESVIEFNDGRFLKCKVFYIDQNSAYIEVEGSERWRMTPATDADYFEILSPMKLGNLPMPEWVIREKA